MSNMGLLHYFLEIKVHQVKKMECLFAKKKYIKHILKKLGKVGCNLVTTPLVVNEKLKMKKNK